MRKQNRKTGSLLAALLLAAPPAGAQGLTTAAEIRPILDATRSNWIALREFDGKDLLYFTHLESWRCGLGAVRFAVNGGSPQVWQMEPCREGTAQPNAIGADRLPYTELPLGSVAKVTVTVVYDDGVEETVDFARAEALIP